MLQRFKKLFKQKGKTKDVNKKFESLAPKALNPKTIEIYIEAIKEGIDDPNIKNIALTGAYGSGKSSILKTFETENKEKYKFLNISLAAFKSVGKGDDKKEFEQLIELSILQQIFYRVKQSKIPDSRFKRIKNLKRSHLFWFSITATIWFISTSILFDFKFVNFFISNKLNEIGLLWTKAVSFIFFLSGIFLFSRFILRTFNNSRINKLNVQSGNIEVSEHLEQSILNKHLDEILYFFEKVHYDIVIIEDLDRFDNTDIFTKLREINTILNSSEQIKRKENKRITFLYAVKDDMFQGHDRTKFFDFIIPVIPIINPSNANDILKERLQKLGSENLPSDEFIDDVSLFIDDMRLLNNICNEYQVYRNNLSPSLQQNNLLAMIVYKNLRPDDFVALHNSKGNIYSLLDKKRKTIIVVGLIREINDDIIKLQKKVSAIENELLKNIQELNAIYVNAIREKINLGYQYHPLGIKIDNVEVTFSELTSSDIHLDSLDKNTKLNCYYTYSSGYSRGSSNLNFSLNDLEDDLPSQNTYNERLKLIKSKSNNKVEEHKQEVYKLEQEKRIVNSWTTQQIFSNISKLDFLAEEEKKDRLMIFLLRNGYINEHYYDYISYFHEISRTREDNEFLLSVKSEIPLEFNFKLTKIKNVISKIQLRYFKSEAILNFDLIDFLFFNPNKYTQQINTVIELIIKSDKGKEFLNEYLEIGKQIGRLIHTLGKKWITFWQFVETNKDYTNEQKANYLQVIIKSVDSKDIWVLNNESNLKSFIENKANFLQLVNNEVKDSKTKEVIEKLKIKFKSIEFTEETKDLFDFVYKDNHYEINENNLNLMLKIYYSKFSDKDFKNKNYSHITHSKEENSSKPLFDYIENNINSYLNNVFFNLKENTNEDEKTIIRLLNSENVDDDLKDKIVGETIFKVGDLEDLEKLDIKVRLFQNDKVMPTWANILNYHDSLEEPKIDITLVDFLDIEENYKTLSKSKFDESLEDKEEEYLKDFSIKLLYNKAQSLESYKALLKSLPNEYKSWNSLGFENLSFEKVQHLVENKYLSFSESNFNKLKEHFSDLHIKLIEKNSISFYVKMDNFDFDESDTIDILNLDISDKYKVKLIQNTEDSVLINNPEIAKKVVDILANYEYIFLEDVVLQGLFSHSKSLDNKIKLLLLNFNYLSNSQITSLVELLGWRYSKMFKSRKHPKFAHNDLNLQLIKRLDEQGLISSYSIDDKKNEIKANALY